ncbi:YktB family protein [Aneurinibacillus uraniidurans]|uniref:YktB family protein n=1 Tax=Aneurinibacillus uraniidurans TaxID=2966586 RepID=UPI00234B7079|nr:DUF1054 domain-containing protein [Aneurinibacillus sp. B1]WCN38960.1 DUF1054 domain-containing protein [Aneurinibacillus sp. B1]
MSYFTEEDFAVFTIPGLDARMEALKATVRPKLEALGARLAPVLSAQCGEEMFAHVAKHARRTINPPSDTWVAWAASKRGYKMLPHFQVGMWETHLFIWFAVIYEAPVKPTFGTRLVAAAEHIHTLVPASYVWSFDHTKPGTIPHTSIDTAAITDAGERLARVKKSELLCGITLAKEEALQLNDQELLVRIEETFHTMQPLYKLACGESI